MMKLESVSMPLTASAIVVGIVMGCIGWYQKSKSDKKVLEYIQGQD